MARSETINKNLNEILALIIHINNFVSGTTLTEFLNDDKTISSVSRNLQLISRKALFISQLTRKNSNFRSVRLPYMELSSMGKRLDHLYQKPSPEVIWYTIDRDLPELERSVKESLGENISENLPARINRYPKITLTKQGEEVNLTSLTLTSDIIPFIEALTELQNIINFIKKEPPPLVYIQYIGQNSPVGIRLKGLAEALNLFINVVVPWRGEYAKDIARLEREEKRINIKAQEADILEKEANAVWLREEAKKISMEVEEKRIELTLKVFREFSPKLSEIEKIALTHQLLKPIKVLSDSSIFATLPENPRK